MPEYYGGGTVRGGYQQAQDDALRKRAADMSQIVGATGVLAKLAEQQEKQRLLGMEQQFRAELAALGPNATQEQLAGVAAKYSGPKEILTSQTSSLDRKAALEAARTNKEASLEQARALQTERLASQEELKREALAQQAEAAKQRSQDMALSQADRNQARMDAIRLAASLRQPPADKTPMGYRPTPEGNLQAIPGGPADTKLQGALNQDTSTLGAMTNNMDRLEREASALLKHPGLSKSTGLMSVVPGVGGIATIPGTDVANFKADLETLKSQAGFSVLQDMRNASKTGGALGQVSDFENRMLQANLASLDRAKSETEFKASLEKIIKYTNDAKDRLRSAYNMKHQGKSAEPRRRASDAPGAVIDFNDLPK